MLTPTRHQNLRLSALLLGLVAGLFSTASHEVLALDRVAVSVKFILGDSGARSQGLYTADSRVREVIEDANRALEVNRADWRLWLTEIGEVEGAGNFFNILDDATGRLLEDSAKADWRKFLWRQDQVNIYVVDSMAPGVGGACSFPVHDELRTLDAIFISNQGIANDGVGWLHEIGHYLSLTHTFESFGAPNPTQACTGTGALHADGKRIRVVDCPDNCPGNTNVMSYNFFATEQASFSPCQLREMRFELDGARSHVVRTEVANDPVLPTPPSSGATPFLRGDTDNSGSVDLGDAVVTLNFLFSSARQPSCLDAADSDDSGSIELSDAVFTLNFLFGGGRRLPAPFESCGVDSSTDALSCETFNACATDEPAEEPHSETLFASADNVFIHDSVDARFGQSVFERDVLAVGCSFVFGLFGPQTRCFYSALKFDLGSEKSERRVRSATLRLFPSRLATNSGTRYAANALNGGWNSRTLSLANAPRFFNEREALAEVPNSTGRALEFDVTGIVQAWVDGDWANNGFALRDISELHPGVVAQRTTEFESTDVHSDPTRRPRLVIEYQ